MLSKNLWKTLSLVAVLLVAAGCTNDGLDDGSSADVILTVVALESQPVTAQQTTAAQGTCSINGNLCESTTDCALNEVCVRATVCLFEVQQWTAQLQSAPKNAFAQPPFNDVNMKTVDVRYDWNPLDGLQFGTVGLCATDPTVVPQPLPLSCTDNAQCTGVGYGGYCALLGTRNFGLGDVAIPAEGSNSVKFFPIAGQDLVAPLEGQTLSMELTFRGRTVEGTDVQGTTRSELYVETCN